tara:strand:- start:15337 stop:16491 length:1155 start_codon:yes stop_codon:yes gene_type:complete
MEEFKVREVGFNEEKSLQETEAELLEKHAEEQGEPVGEQKIEESVVSAEGAVVDVQHANEEQEANTIKAEIPEEALTDDSVLSYIKDRYDKNIGNLNDLFQERESNEDLPEDVSAFLKFKKETGRGLEDFIAVNKDYDKANPDDLLYDYWKQTKPHLDNEDIDFELDSKFGFDEEVDEEDEVRRRKIAKKEELVKAKEYFGKQKEQYHMPLESRAEGVPDAEKEGYEAYKKYVEESKGLQDVSEKKRKIFEEETGKVFNKDFEGFKFAVEGKDLLYKPAEADKLRDSQSDINNFIGSHLDDEGIIKDAAAYHRSIAVAMNPESFAKFFYEQGKADAVDDYSKESKNIDMNVRSAPESLSKGGFKVTALSEDHGNRLRIKSPKNR